MAFECATNMTDYIIIFAYGSNVLPNETILPNGRKRTTFTATSNINGTDIICIASMNTIVNSTGLAYLYIQGILAYKFLCYITSGPPDSVSNLQGCRSDFYCMFISWDPPYTLPGLTVQYIISVGTEQHELNSTNYTYCPLNLTNEEYLFNTTTSNKAGIGSTSNITVRFQSSKKCM